MERFQTFTVLMTHISRCIRRIKTEEMAEFDLKSHHVSCLYYLYRMGSLTAKELCDVCEEDKANISRTIEYLEASGYLICKSTAQKRYKSPLELTEKGREIGARIAEKVQLALAEASSGLSDEDRIQMYQSLALISANLQKICDKYDD